MNVYIPIEQERRLWSFIEALDTEVGGFGAAFVEDGEIEIADVFLVPQLVSGSVVDFDGDGIAAAIERLGDRTSEPDFVLFSWHSHHKMNAFWSQTDEECITTYATAGIPALLSFVGTHSHAYKLRLDLFGVKHHGVTVSTMTLDNLKLLTEQESSIAAEIAANVREHKVKAVKFLGPGPSRHAAPEPLPGDAVQRALQIRELMEGGLTRYEAEQYVDYEGLVDHDGGEPDPWLVACAGWEGSD